MAVDKMSLSFPPGISERIKLAAKQAGTSTSSWVADAARMKLRNEALRAYLDEYQAEHGAFTDEELAEASQALGLAGPAQIDAAA